MKGIPKKEDPEPETSTDGTLGLGTRYPGPENVYVRHGTWDPQNGTRDPEHQNI